MKIERIGMRNVDFRFIHFLKLSEHKTIKICGQKRILLQRTKLQENKCGSYLLMSMAGIHG